MADSAQKPAQRKRMTTREFVTALKLHAAGAKAMRDAKKFYGSRSLRARLTTGCWCR
jgi:hypothetical protein